MMTTDQESQSRLGLQLDAETKISADWKGLVSNLSEAVAGAFVKGPADALTSSVSSLIKLSMSVKLNPSIGYRVWELSLLAFAWSIDRVYPLSSLSEAEARTALRAGIDSAKRQAEESGVFVPTSFLERPTTIPIYQCLKTSFVDSIEKNDKARSKGLGSRLDEAFNRAIYELWARKPDYYAPVEDAISASGRTAAELSVNWAAYRSQLIYEFDVKPVFGQEEGRISLSQLYVPLRAAWSSNRVDTGADDVDSIDIPTDDFSTAENILMLDESLKDWVQNRKADDSLRLIGGGPGSGKSTTLRALAREVAMMPDRRPLFIPLQHIDLDRDLRDSINNYFTQTTGSLFVQPPLSRPAIEDGPPILLIFDGLDEIAAPGEAAKDVIGTFANRLSSLIYALEGAAKDQVSVIISGRMPAFQAARRYLTPKEGGALEVLGFLPVRRYKADEDSLWKIDQRILWWKQYAELKGLEVDTPEAFKDPRIASLSHEPLLCYLLALAGYATEHWQKAADNRNRIYAELVNSVYERGWGDGKRKRQGPGKSLSQADFNKLMETIALAAWLGGDARVASEENFEAAVVMTNAASAWKLFKDDNGPDVTNLAMNFYLKASELSQRGFEFTHKSFGEYLASRALIRIAKEVANEFARKPEYAMLDWFRATRTGHMTLELITFLTDEARLQIADSNLRSAINASRDLKDSLTRFLERIDEAGFAFVNEGQNFRVMEAEQRNAEIAAWAATGAFAKALARSGAPKKAIIEFSWQSTNNLEKILQRLSLNDSDSPIFLCMSYIDVRNQKITEIVASDLTMEGCVWGETLFARCDISRGLLSSTNAGDIRLYECRMRRVLFRDFKSSEFVIHNCVFSGCNFDALSEGHVTVSPLSIMSFDDNTLAGLEGAMVLLNGSRIKKDQIIKHLNARIKIVSSIEDVQVSNLVTDWD